MPVLFSPQSRGFFKIATAVFVSKAIGFIVCGGGGIEMWARVIGMGGAAALAALVDQVDAQTRQRPHAPGTHPEFDRLVRTIWRLRQSDGCPWDKVQTHDSITKNMVEEAYEAVEVTCVKISDTKNPGFMPLATPPSAPTTRSRSARRTRPSRRPAPCSRLSSGGACGCSRTL